MNADYNLDELDDIQTPQGRDFKYLVGLVEKVLAENEEIKNELINLNTPFPILTKEEAAEFLRVSERTVTNWSNQGIIPVYELGDKSIRYKRKDLEACLKRRDGKNFNPRNFRY